MWLLSKSKSLNPQPDPLQAEEYFKCEVPKINYDIFEESDKLRDAANVVSFEGDNDAWEDLADNTYQFTSNMLNFHEEVTALDAHNKLSRIYIKQLLAKHEPETLLALKLKGIDV